MTMTNREIYDYIRCTFDEARAPSGFRLNVTRWVWSEPIPRRNGVAMYHGENPIAWLTVERCKGASYEGRVVMVEDFDLWDELDGKARLNLRLTMHRAIDALEKAPQVVKDALESTDVAIARREVAEAQRALAEAETALSAALAKDSQPTTHHD